MLGLISRIFSDGDASLRSRLFGLYAVLIGANVLVWAWALVVLRDRPVLLGTALLAYASACATPSTPTISRPSTT